MTREQLKNWAKTALSRSYWKSVFVGFLLAFTAGTGAGSGSSSSGDFSEVNFDNMSEEEIMFLVGIIIFILVIGFAFWILGMVLKSFLFNPLHVGCRAYFNDGLENPDPDLGLLGRGFKGNYKNVAITMFMKDLYLWLWSLLSWIPAAIFIGLFIVSMMFEGTALEAVLIIVGVLILLVGMIAAMIPWIMKTYEYWMIPYILADNPNMSTKEAFALTKKMMTGHKWECFVLNLSFFGWVFLSLCTCGILSIFYVEPYKAYTMAGFYKVRAQQMKYLNAPIDGYNQ